MFDPSSFANTTPLTHADASRDVLPRGKRYITDSLRNRLEYNSKSACILKKWYVDPKRFATPDLVPFRCSPVSSCAEPLQTEGLMGERQGCTHNKRSYPKCPSAMRLRMVREDTKAPSEGATCAWMAADKAVGCTKVTLKDQTATVLMTSRKDGILCYSQWVSGI
ncbi:hypothetical protein TNCV_4698881 [Trichonephila clavipes]|nr:hypothetical protein TNCV_4698881 [Trichonephila clavipes]